MGERLIAYLASPYGFYEHGRNILKESIIPDLLETGIYEIVEPFDTSPPGTSERDIIKNNREGRARSNLLVAILDGSGVLADEGVAIEAVEFCQRGLPVFALSTDFRRNLKEENKGINHELYYPIVENAEKIGYGGIAHYWNNLLDMLRAYVRSRK